MFTKAASLPVSPLNIPRVTGFFPWALIFLKARTHLMYNFYTEVTICSGDTVGRTTQVFI